MKLIDMLAGMESDDPKDEPSGVKLTVEPSAGLLETIDVFAKEYETTREGALLACATLGAVSKKAVGGFFSALVDAGDPRATDDIEIREADMRRKELVLARALARKEALEDAAKTCDMIAKDIDGWTHDKASAVDDDPSLPAVMCANAVRELKKRVIEETDRAFGRTS